MKKKLLLLTLLFLCQGYFVFAQHYKATISGYVSGDPGLNYNIRDCPEGNFVNVQLHYTDGTSSIEKRVEIPIISGHSFTIEYAAVSNTALVKSIYVHAGRAFANASKCRDQRASRTTNVGVGDRSNFNLKKKYRNVIPEWIGDLELQLEPIFSIDFAKNDDRSQVKFLCVNEALAIKAAEGYEDKKFEWQYKDGERDDTTKPTPAFKILLDKRNRAFEEMTACFQRVSQTREDCTRYSDAYGDTFTEIYNFRGQRYAQTGNWRFIFPRKTGREVGITLRDIFPDEQDYRNNIGKPIIIRAVYQYNDNPSTNALSVQFNPEPPNEAQAPKIIQPTCSYKDDATFTLYFNRQINSSEELYLNLKKKEERGSFQPTDFDIIKSFTKIGNKLYKYDWPLSKKKLLAGEYKAIISGFERGNASAGGKPICEQSYYFFKINAPDSVEFAAKHIQNEQCYDSKDGRIEISASGGTGTYSYILNGSNWSGAKTFTAAQSPIILSNIKPDTYYIQVRDSKGCYDLDALSDPLKTEKVVITAKQQMSHTIDLSETNPIHPSAPRLSDGTITITAISGGTPKNDVNGNFMEYIVLLNGVSTNTLTGSAYTKGFTINGLPKGNHKIRYTDANNCSITLDLPLINDPDPITYTLTKETPSCWDAKDGRLTVTNILGGYPDYKVHWVKDGIPVSANTLSITTDAGNYILTITDTRSGRVTQNNIRFDNLPQPITFTQNISPILCYNGKALVTITARGGQPPYQYGVWSGSTVTWYDTNTFELSASSGAGYRFQVREQNNAGCETNISNYFRITEPREITLDSSRVVDNTIFGDNKGAITITVSGGTPTYTVSWTKVGDASFSRSGLTISGLTTGNYIPTITDRTGPCSYIGDPIFVDQPEKLLLTIDNTTGRILCHGATGSLIAKATGGSGNYSYTWLKDGNILSGETKATITNTTFGNYSLQVSDGYTSVTNTTILIEPELLQLLARSTNPSCYKEDDGTIILTPEGGTPPYSFSIDDKQHFIPETSLTNRTISGLKEGLYEVWIKDGNGCQTAVPVRLHLIAPTAIVIAEEAVIDVTTLGGNDGSIDISITGGLGQYTIDWTRKEDPSYSQNNEDISNLAYGSYTVMVMDGNNCVIQRTFNLREPLPMNVTIALETPILCHNDTTAVLRATVTGGYPIESTPSDFEYQWFRVENAIETPLNTDFSLDSISDLPSGLYKVQIRDIKGATTSTTFEITQPDDLAVSLAREPIPVLCHGNATGVITAIVTGGPKDISTTDYLPYSYQWSKEGDSDFVATTATIDRLSAGRYSLIATDANLCTVTLENIVITQPEAPLEITDVQFTNLTGYQTQNGTISIDVQGGTTPYEYEWTALEDATFSSSSEDLKNLQKGTYQLQVTDASNCIITLEQVLIEPDELLITITELTLQEGIQCHGQNTLVPLTTTTKGGFGTYTYQWFEQDAPTNKLFTTLETTPVRAGTYRVVVTDENGNIASDSYNVGEPEALEITEQVRPLLCNNDTDGAIAVRVHGGVPPYTYRWSTGQNTSDIAGLRAGNYRLFVQDANECSVSKTIEVQQPRALFANITRTYPSSNGANDGHVTIAMTGGTTPYTFEWREISGTLLSETGNTLTTIGAGKYSVTITDAHNCSLVIDDVDLFEPPVLEVFIDELSVVSCFGSTSSASLAGVVTGGVPYNANKQYSYNWYDATTNLSVGVDAPILKGIGAGVYYVVITDAIGTTTTSSPFDLKQPEALSLTLHSDFTNCGDQQDWMISSTVQGGTPPYQYRWNTRWKAAKLENIVADSYSLEVTDDRGCRISQQITLTPPAPLTASVTTTIPTCFGGCDGQILISPSGGTAPYQYRWNDTSTEKDVHNACKGTYSVVITDNKGCQFLQTIVIENPPQRIIDLGSDITLCKEQSITINAAITDPNATYRWTSDNGFSATTQVVELDQTGFYTVVVTDSKGCMATDTIFIETTTKEIYTEFITNSQVFVGEKFLLFDISDPVPDGLQWRFPEAATVHYRDSDYAELSFDHPGEYAVEMKATFGLCSQVKTKTIVVIERTFEQDQSLQNTTKERTKFRIYPNPTKNGKFTIAINMSKTQAVSLKVYGMGNNTVLNTKKGKEKKDYEFLYELSQLPGGTYFVLFETPSGDQVHKLVIE